MQALTCTLLLKTLFGSSMTCCRVGVCVCVCASIGWQLDLHGKCGDASQLLLCEMLEMLEKPYCCGNVRMGNAWVV